MTPRRQRSSARPVDDTATGGKRRFRGCSPGLVPRRWLGFEPDPHDVLRPFSSELLWPIPTRVNSPMNDDEGLLTALPAA
jgi:hypothetical protein